MGHTGRGTDWEELGKRQASRRLERWGSKRVRTQNLRL
jgi:hypothetical protein